MPHILVGGAESVVPKGILQRPKRLEEDVLLVT